MARLPSSTLSWMWAEACRYDDESIKHSGGRGDSLGLGLHEPPNRCHPDWLRLSLAVAPRTGICSRATLIPETCSGAGCIGRANVPSAWLTANIPTASIICRRAAYRWSTKPTVMGSPRAWLIRLDTSVSQSIALAPQTQTCNQACILYGRLGHMCSGLTERVAYHGQSTYACH
jgi:hypothetical protein